MTVYLDAERLLQLVQHLGVGPVRDFGLLDSAAQRPGSTLWGSDAYEGIPLKAAALLESLTRNRPLVDGNKRLGWLALFVFLDLNGYDLEPPNDDVAYDFAIAVASGQLELEQAAATLEPWMLARGGN